jgi:predicted DNA-binding protein (MmcQ/YjbR family)
MWLKKIIPGLRVVDSISKSLMIYCDNKAAVFFSYNNKSSETVKHIDLSYLVVKERVHDHTINLKHIDTKEMLTDPLTKGLPPHIF